MDVENPMPYFFNFCNRLGFFLGMDASDYLTITFFPPTM